MNRIRSLSILVIVFSIIISCMIPVAFAATDGVILSTNSVTLSGTGNVPLYVDEDTPLTFQYFLDHPEYTLHIQPVSTTTKWTFNVASGRLYFGIYGYAAIDSEYVTQLASSYGNVRSNMNSPLLFNNEDSSYSKNHTLWVTYDGSGDVEDPTEPPTEEPTEPPIVDDGSDEDDGSGLFAKIKEFISNYFNLLLEPFRTFINYFRDWIDNGGFTNGILEGIKGLLEAAIKTILDVFVPQSTIDATNRLFAALADFFSRLGDFGEHMAAVYSFLDTISTNATTILSTIWDFPLIKELSIAAVIVMLVSGVFGFLVSP